MTGLHPYLRVYQRRSPSLGLSSPGVPDPPWVPDPDPTSTYSLVNRVGMVSSWTPPPGDDFVLRSTQPACANPLVPTGSDNAGWSGDISGGTFTSLHTVPSGTTRRGCVFLHDINLTDETSVLEDCIIFGGPTTTSRLGIVAAPNGGQLIRCTFFGWGTSVAYYRNAVRLSAGILRVTRCVFMRTVDGVRASGGRVISHGNVYGPFAFFNNDLDHSTGDPNLWTHNDGCQITAGAGPHEFIGDYVRAWCDTTGVTWSGGSPGAGTASNGAVPTVHPTSRPTVATPIGMPAAQLNGTTHLGSPRGPYRNAFVEGNYSNGFMFSNTSGFDVTVEDCWLEGGNNPSALIQFTTGTANTPKIRRNRFGVGGYRTGTTRFLVSYPTGTTAVMGTGADANVFGNFPSCVAAGIVGDPITVTGSGGRYNA